EREGLRVKHRLLARTCELPGRHVAKALIVAPRLALRRLVLLAEVAAARLLAPQGVVTHQLGELEEVGHAAGVLERLVQLLALAADVQVTSKPFRERRDFLESLLQALNVPRHAALVPHQPAPPAVEGDRGWPTPAAHEPP